MGRVWFIVKEMWHLVREHRLYVISPILLTLALLALVAFYIGPTVVLTFLYAGL
jgi:hypothetical protein